MASARTSSDVELFRSDVMNKVQLIVPAEAARATAAALGELGLLQLKDLNEGKSAFQRTYANQVKRCDEMARKLRFFSAEIAKSGLTAHARSSLDVEPTLDELEGRLAALEGELLEINSNSDKLKKSHSELVELQLVLEKAGGFFDEARADAGIHQREQMEMGGGGSSSGMLGGGASSSTPFLDGGDALGAGGGADAEAGWRSHENKAVRLGFVTGIVAQEKVPSFERVLFRATRGNMFLRTAAVDGTVCDPGTGERLPKSVFIIFFAGERARAKVLKICEAFGANRYPFPEDITRQRQMNAEVNVRLRELHTTIDASSVHRDGLLAQVGSSVESWTAQVRREKAVYHALNMFSVDVTHKCLVAEGWCPAVANSQVQAALVGAASRSSAQTSPIMQVLSTRETPPTYFRTTKITEVFQGIVDAYGIADYQEANPAVFTMVTFPFLFAVMFGDFGHGVLMLLFALYLVLNERALKAAKLNEIFGMLFGGRYIILPMAVFSIYTGLLYNECFSCPMTLFGNSNYEYEEGKSHPTWNGKAYGFGLDPAWHGTKGELPFTNSMKMKMSIIMGVLQMDLGIVMSLFNALYFKKPIDIYHQFIPQMLFLNGLFGYLSMLIVIKWVTGSTADLYHIMIFMFLAPGQLEKENTLFPGQAVVQVLLVLMCMVCVPWMLFTKPYLLKKQHQARSGGYTALTGNAVFADDDSDDGGHGGSGEGEGETFDYADTLVHQMIHTVEFVLGAVSNTASYLRLWALSLAHAQLSAVFWDRMLLLSITFGPTAMIIGFGAWFGATMGVLMTMESLSAFLHALRLHWVEYQNKFFGGNGKQFLPFDLKKIDEEAEAEEAA